jgi:hypothetical protein
LERLLNKNYRVERKLLSHKLLEEEIEGVKRVNENLEVLKKDEVSFQE